MLSSITRWFRPDLAIDLGTSNTLVAVQGVGVVLDEPSIVALDTATRAVLGRGTAVGTLAKQMVGRTPGSMTAVRPIRGGVVTDFDVCEAMLRYFLRKALKRSPAVKPRVVIVVPGGLTPVERRAVFASTERAGAGRVLLLEAGVAAAIGGGLPISEPLANLVCDIGGGTSEVALVSLGEVVASQSLRIAGEEFDQAVSDYLKRAYSLRIGRSQAEQIKIEIGSVHPRETEISTEVRGLDVGSGTPRKVTITSEELREALLEPALKIVEGVRSVIERSDPELVGDISDTGLLLSGGGSLLEGLDRLLTDYLGIPVRHEGDPHTTAARGASICLDHIDLWQGHLLSD